ncbi:MAG: hypothetical protein OCD76_13860 [Reichenbachiella sp.]
MKDIRRRKFITNSVKSLIATGGAMMLGKQVLFAQTVPNNKYIKSQTMNTQTAKTLVVYQSQFGSTGEVAAGIATVLEDMGTTVALQKIEDVSNLASYDKIIIGSAIQYDHWMSETREFVTTHQHILKDKSVAFFFVCLTLSDPSEKAKTQANGYAEKIRALVPDVSLTSIGGFAGVLDYSKMSWSTQLLAKVFMSIFGVKEGDYRDWVGIQAWARNLGF